MSGTGVLVLAAALVLTAVAAWWLRTRDGRLRAAPDEAEEDGVGPTAVLERLGVRPGDAELTVVQFSTAFCGPCRTTRARLQHLRDTRPGLAYVHVDAESHLDAVRELDVRRTPTLFYLDRQGRLLGRSSGALRPEDLGALVDAHTGARP
ncbi:thiol-disulfide isomerase/thioredoxin [Geodermatophilus bullaregiensis]|uniref:thioredoxin family protein n=1 Tax=Geodermatophilus bullaregiensis TaxID=1564160 RepID=UPI00195B683F|nr:thioredoxin family protein [Geodermatophilus bullaregiensis]MBM7806124.1 thiol-disulfide isomerase/thioredoxin [Geodermatophilus bullaregiensis]